MQTLSELFDLVYSYDARLFIKIYIQGFLRALITNLLLDLQIQNDRSNMADKILKKNPLFGDKIGICIRIFKVADYESAVRFETFKITDPIWRIKF